MCFNVIVPFEISVWRKDLSSLTFKYCEYFYNFTRVDARREIAR